MAYAGKAGSPLACDHLTDFQPQFVILREFMIVYAQYPAGMQGILAIIGGYLLKNAESLKKSVLFQHDPIPFAWQTRPPGHIARLK